MNSLPTGFDNMGCVIEHRWESAASTNAHGLGTMVMQFTRLFWRGHAAPDSPGRAESEGQTTPRREETEKIMATNHTARSGWGRSEVSTKGAQHV